MPRNIYFSLIKKALICIRDLLTAFMKATFKIDLLNYETQNQL